MGSLPRSRGPILRDAAKPPTPDTFSQQLGYMNRPKGYVIPPHDHNAVPRTIEWTQEVLIIRSGKVRLDLYEPTTRVYLESHVLLPGDIVLLAHGGHGFVMLEQSEMVEVKQGPYAGDMNGSAPSGKNSCRSRNKVRLAV